MYLYVVRNAQLSPLKWRKLIRSYMAGLSKIKQRLSGIEALERELHLKQLQINQLLNITQAINSNVSAEGLFRMFESFLGWEIGVKKMVLYIKNEQDWECAASLGLTPQQLAEDVTDLLAQITRMKNIEDSDHPLMGEFDLVIPVRHKDHPIAYVFIGGFSDDEDMYSKVQFITTITNIIAVAIENKRLFKRQIEQERLKREVELASEIQRMLIPTHLPQTKAYEIESIYKPQLGVGGDYFDFLEFEDGKVVFCVGDISGKGLAAALLMANFQAIFHTLINKRDDLVTFIHDLNQAVHRMTGGDRFITFFIGEYDTHCRKLKYISAGHNPPVLVINGRPEFLTEGCTILGSFKELPAVGVGECLIEGEAVALVYTDGLTDLLNKDGIYFDEDRVSQFTRENYKLSPLDIKARLLDEIEAFKGDQLYPDDFTVLICKIFG